MPYIKEDIRNEIYQKFLSILDGEVDSLDFRKLTPGELNYLLTMIVIEYTKAHGVNYTTLNTVIGALTCCRDEFRRQVVDNYENKKMKENGDVYDSIK